MNSAFSGYVGYVAGYVFVSRNTMNNLEKLRVYAIYVARARESVFFSVFLLFLFLLDKLFT